MVRVGRGPLSGVHATPHLASLARCSIREQQGDAWQREVPRTWWGLGGAGSEDEELHKAKRSRSRS
jgi:hypothetical protein